MVSKSSGRKSKSTRAEIKGKRNEIQIRRNEIQGDFPSADGSHALFHGPRCIGRYDANGALRQPDETKNAA